MSNSTREARDNGYNDAARGLPPDPPEDKDVGLTVLTLGIVPDPECAAYNEGYSHGRESHNK